MKPSTLPGRDRQNKKMAVYLLATKQVTKICLIKKFISLQYYNIRANLTSSFIITNNWLILNFIVNFFAI